MSNIKISVLVPVYNQEKYIGRCLRSLLDQNLSSKEYEIIIINDGSDDKSSYALNLFKGNNIKLINNKKNKGLPYSLNKGIKESSGDYIVRVDSDDYVNTNYLSILKLYLDLNDSCDAVSCNYLLVDENENVLRCVDFLKEPIGCAIMFKKKHLVKIGLYDTNLKINEEKDLLIRFKNNYNLESIKFPLYRYRKHIDNMTNDIDEVKYFDKKLKQKHSDK